MNFCLGLLSAGFLDLCHQLWLLFKIPGLIQPVRVSEGTTTVEEWDFKTKGYDSTSTPVSRGLDLDSHPLICKFHLGKKELSQFSD